jgi:hypothetical protein
MSSTVRKGEKDRKEISWKQVRMMNSTILNVFFPPLEESSPDLSMKNSSKVGPGRDRNDQYAHELTFRPPGNSSR